MWLAAGTIAPPCRFRFVDAARALFFLASDGESNADSSRKL